MVTMPVNCAKAWTRIVRAIHKVTRRPQVTLSREPVPVKAKGRRS